MPPGGPISLLASQSGRAAPHVEEQVEGVDDTDDEDFRALQRLDRAPFAIVHGNREAASVLDCFEHPRVVVAVAKSGDMRGIVRFNMRFFGFVVPPTRGQKQRTQSSGREFGGSRAEGIRSNYVDIDDLVQAPQSLDGAGAELAGLRERAVKIRNDAVDGNVQENLGF